MREIHILWAGRHRRRPWEALCADYRGRIERHLAVQDRLIKAAAGGDGKTRRRAEGRALLAALPDPCWTVALDAGGEALGSDGLAERLARLRAEWPHALAFVIGSDLGLDPEILERARLCLSFGPAVFGHELARLVLYEQIYRALAAERGIKYHRQPF